MKQIILTFSLISFGFLFSECSNKKATPSKDSSEKKVTAKKPLDDRKEVQRHADPETIDPYLEEIKTLLNFKEPIQESLEWKDSVGRHIVIMSQKDIYWTDSDYNTHDLQNAEVNCYHYLQKNAEEKFTQVWKIQDYVKDCEVDAIAKFKKNVLQKTDLNENGIAEVWVMYSTACKGDVSPSILKLIMYEGNQKYKMTGETRVDIGSEYMGGNISSEGKFTERPIFLEFAKTLWKKNVNEVFGE